ncbi:MAG: oxidoreductase [Lentisphaerae bacterium RIFOXYB12_FULL_65_16]|nr:MAG: oxidoreductase [Lentisphaerae bacterium RIFOXYA12_64_32]OGV88554.1 MAG: oxidoreductase [Lentisphaerae bacterium RIFOXYB12_FULL_65_16]
MKKTTQIRVGVIGVTGRGGLARQWHKPDGGRSVLVAGADVKQDALDAFKAEVNKDAFTTLDYRELIARDDIDAVAVCSPDFTHEEYACAALAAGKHVFCEKPMAITTEGCDRMLKAWKKSGKKFMIGFNMRYMNIFRTMKDVVDSGVIGEIKVVWCRHFVGFGGDWYYHDWHGNSKNSTGLLLQKASHDIDMIHWITGQYTKRVSGFGSLDYYGGNKPNDLVCNECAEKRTCVEYQYNETTRKVNRMNQCVFRKEIDVEDNSTIMMEMENGIHATYMQCHYTPDYCRNYTFIGTEGRIENVDDGTNVIVKLRNRSKRWKNIADQHLTIKPAVGGHGGADPVIADDFLDMVLDGKEPIATPMAGRMSVAVGVAATHSIRHGSGGVNIPRPPACCRQ